MPRERWKLTESITGEPELDVYGEPMVLGVFGNEITKFSLLYELAQDLANGLEQLSPGVYRISKDPGDSCR
jgi:hypothetical protein